MLLDLFRISRLMLLTLALVGCTQQEEGTSSSSIKSNTSDHYAHPSKSSRPIHAPLVILALGDSLTEGLGVERTDNYPAQLERALHEQGIHATVVNSGLSGETSSGLVNRLDWALKTQPDLTLLTIGGNDAMRGIKVATIENNIRNTIAKIRDSGSRVVLSGMQIYDNLGQEYVDAFAEMYPRIAAEEKVTLIPFFLDGVAADNSLNQGDRIHPNAAGYAHIVKNNILPVLKPLLQSMSSDQGDDLINE